VLEEKLRQADSEHQDTLKSYELRMEKLKTTEEKRYKAEKDIFDRSLADREAKIQKLEKEIAYLSTLLTYWKPLDELKDYNIDHETSFQNELVKKDDSAGKRNVELQQPVESTIMTRSIRMSKQLDAPQKDVSS
jgi:hypothetical protein